MWDDLLLRVGEISERLQAHIMIGYHLTGELCLRWEKLVVKAVKQAVFKSPPPQLTVFLTIHVNGS